MNMRKFTLLAISILMIAMSGCVDNKSEQVSTQTPVAPVTTVTETPISEDENVTVDNDTNVTTSEDENVTVDNDTNVTTSEDDNVTTSEDENATVGNDTEETTPVVKIYSVGDSINDGNTKMTLNSIRYTNTISEKSAGYNVTSAESGNKFLILDITIENIGQDINISYDGSKFFILDTDETSERNYEEDVLSSEGWTKHFDGNDISPGNKRQGELAFQVPKDAGGLQLRFEYYSESSEDTTLEFFTLN